MPIDERQLNRRANIFLFVMILAFVLLGLSLFFSEVSGAWNCERYEEECGTTTTTMTPTTSSPTTTSTTTTTLPSSPSDCPYECGPDFGPDSDSPEHSPTTLPETEIGTPATIIKQPKLTG